MDERFPLAYFYTKNDNYEWYCGYDEDGRMHSVHVNKENDKKIVTPVTKTEAEKMETILLLSGWVPIKAPRVVMKS